MGTPSNSSGTSGTPVKTFCECCHASSEVTTHWDHPSIKICIICKDLLFRMEAEGGLTHTVYAFMNRLQAGDL